MRYWILTLFLILALPHTGYAQSAYQDDLIALRKSIKSISLRESEIQATLNELENEQESLSKALYDRRFQATRNLHAYHTMQLSNPVLNFIASDDGFYERYFNQRYQNHVNTIIRQSINQDIESLIALETKIQAIAEFRREKDLLNETLNIAMNQIQTINDRNSENKELLVMIEEMKNQSASLNNFIAQLLELSPTESYSKPNNDSFILPASGILNQNLTGVYIKTSGTAAIAAPADGKILFAGHYKRLGNVIIMDHGNGYTSIIRGVSELAVTAGNILIQGDTIGMIKNSEKNRDETIINPMLYYELRYNGTIINPIEKLSGS